MAIAFIDSGTYTEKSDAEVDSSIPCPATVNAGDLLVCIFNVALAANPGNPSGWTSAGTANAGGSSPGCEIFYKVAVGNEDGTSITITHNSAISKGQILRFSGVDQTTPIDVAASSYSNANADTAYTLPSITTTTTGCCLIYTGSANANSGTWTPPTVPSTFTELVDDASLVPSSSWGYLIWSGSGATGDVNLTRSTSIRGAALLIALRPAASGSSHTQTPTDGAGLVDSALPVNTKPPVLLTDATGTVDAQSFVTDYVVTLDDSAGLVDTATPVNGPVTVPTVVGAGAFANASTQQTIAFTLPASIPENSVLLFATNAAVATGTVTSVSNVTETVLDLQRSGSPVVLSAYLFHAIVGSANNGQTVTVTWSNANLKISCAWIVVDGVRTTVNALPPSMNDGIPADTIAFVPPLTPNVDDLFLVSFVSGQHSTAGTTFTKDADYTLGGSAFYGGADPKQSTSVTYLQLTTDAGVERSGDQHEWSASSREVSWVVGLQADITADYKIFPTDVEGLVDGINAATVFGQASGHFGGTHTATGVRRVLGVAAGALGFTGTVLGIDRAIGLAVGNFGFVGTAQGIKVARYVFSPPAHEEPMRTRVRPHNRHRLTYATSIVRINGVLTPYRSPNFDLLTAAGVEGVDWFIGGNVYFVSEATRAELLSLGYTVTTT